ncbi:MAG TPA: MFS transporter, partial [Acidimicrobiales bacterium]|nr:MFS transporter [Acidimicrobiales bacterium]
AMAVVMSPISGALVGRRGPRLPLVLSGCALTISSLMMTGLTPTTSFSWLILAYLLFGIGFGLVNPPITQTAVSGMPAAQAGVAAAVASTSRQVGQSLGVAVVGVAATMGLHGSLSAGLAQASHPGWWIITGCGLGVLVLGVATTSARARRSAQRTADLLGGEVPVAAGAR